MRNFQGSFRIVSILRLAFSPSSSPCVSHYLSLSLSLSLLHRGCCTLSPCFSLPLGHPPLCQRTSVAASGRQSGYVARYAARCSGASKGNARRRRRRRPSEKTAPRSDEKGHGERLKLEEQEARSDHRGAKLAPRRR